MLFDPLGGVDLDRCLEVATAAALAAGAEITSAWHGVARSTVEYKGAVDLVTETDKKCEDIIFRALAAAFPHHVLVGEESAAAGNGDGRAPPPTDAPTWYVDPLDGTTNFVHRYPNSCVAIGLCVHHTPVVGVVFNPITHELFTAALGRGAKRNGAPIATSNTDVLARALVATEIGVGRDANTVDAMMGRIAAVVPVARSLRCTGSCAMNMCAVACGRLDAYFEIGLGGPWDVVGAACVLTEAGGVVVDPAGGAFDPCGRRVLCANNNAIARALGAAIAPVPDGALEPHALGHGA